MKQALYLQQGKEPNGSLFLARAPGGGLLYRLDGPRDSLTLHSRFFAPGQCGEAEGPHSPGRAYGYVGV